MIIANFIMNLRDRYPSDGVYHSFDPAIRYPTVRSWSFSFCTGVRAAYQIQYYLTSGKSQTLKIYW